MNVTFENLINVWDAQIPNLLVELVNHAVFATDKKGFQAVITKLSKTTDFDKFFAYGYGRNRYRVYHQKNKIKSNIELISINNRISETVY